MAEEKAQAVAQGDGDANAEVQVAEATGAQAQQTKTGQAVAKAPASPRTLAEVMDDPKASQEELEAAIIASERADLEARQAAIDDTDDSGQTQEQESESTEQGEEADDEGDGEGDGDAAKAADAMPEPKRIKPADPYVRKLNDLIRGGMPAGEAVAFLAKQSGAKASVEATPEAAAKEEQKAANPVAEKQAELDDLLAQQDAAIDGFDTAEQKRLSREIIRVQRELNRAEVAAERAHSETQARHVAEQDAAIAVVKSALPEMFTEGTALKRAADSIGEQMPDEFYMNPKWPKLLAAMAHAEAYPDRPIPALNGKPAAQPAVETVKAPMRVPVKKVVSAALLATGRGGGNGTVFERALRPEATQADIEAAAQAEHEAAMRRR